MKKISYVEVKRTGGGGRSPKKKLPKAKQLNITSLIDILTILLVFLIKNVSMDAQKVNPPEGMTLPSTAVKEDLIENGQTVLIKVYPNQILFGSDSVPVGSPDDFMTNENTRKALLYMLQDASNNIKRENEDAIPCILIQADNDVQCKFVTEIIKVSANSAFNQIYFSSLYAADQWNRIVSGS